MKRILSVFLVLILIISSISSVLFASPLAELPKEGPINYAPKNWQAGAHWHNNGGRVTSTTDSHLGGAAFTVSSGSSNYQFADASETVTLAPNTNYRFFISVKGLTAQNKSLLEKVLVYTGGAREAAGNSEAFPATQWVASISSSVVDAESSNNGWLRLYFDFKTNDSTTYDLRLKWSNISSFTISDIALYAKAKVSTNADGNGNAFVSTVGEFVGDTVTLTAVAGKGDNFIGWYNSENQKLSDEQLFTTNITNAKESFTAKFSGTKPINYDNASWQASEHWKNNNGGSNGLVTGTETHLGGAAYKTVLSPAYQYIYASEVALLPNTEYQVSFSVKVSDKSLVNALSVYNGGTLKTCTSEIPPSEQRVQYCATDAVDTTLNGGGWLRLTYTFKTTSLTSYDFRINFGNISSLNISDFTINAKAKIGSNIVGDGAATVSEAVGYVGQTVTYKAYVKVGENFIGWYSDEDVLLGKDLTLNYCVDKPDTKVTAKFSGSLAKNYASSAWQSTAHWYNNGGRLEETADNHLGGKAFTVSSGSPNYQYIDTTESIELLPNTEYSFSVSVKGITVDTKSLLEALVVYNGGTKVAAGNSETFPSEQRVAYVSVSAVDTVLSNEEWIRLNFNFKTNDSTTFDLRLRWGNISNYTISDITLYAKANVTINTDGNGEASVSNSTPYVGQTVILKANPKADDSFLGWYDGETKISKEKEFAYKVVNAKTVLIAKFSGENSFIIKEDFEKYAPYESFIDRAVVKNDDWSIASRHDLGWQNVQAIDNPYEGNNGLMLAAANSLVGRKVKGLKKNTDYVVSFYVKQPSAVGNVLDKILVLPSDVIPATVGGTELTNKSNGVMGYLENEVTANGNWQKVEVLFNSGNNTDATVWIRYAAQGNPYELSLLYIDNFEVFNPVKITTRSSNGGSISANFDGDYIALGEDVILSATPYVGNTFKGWFDSKENLISNEPNYSFRAKNQLDLYAVFEGYNMPARDVLAMQGQDGTFENGSVAGWYATDQIETGHDWCLFQRTDKYAFDGTYSLMLYSRYRDTVLPLTNLQKDTDYHFSFNFLLPEETGEKGSIRNFGIVGENDTNVQVASVKYYTSTQIIDHKSGWYKADIYFNTANAEAVNFVLRYYANDAKDGYEEYCYLDNLSLIEYTANETLNNGEFSDGSNYWLGESFAHENDSIKLLQTGSSIYQSIKTDKTASYTVKFRAKGNVTAAINEVECNNLNVKKQITSQSVLKTSGDFKDYEINVFSGIHKAVNLVFASNDGDAYIDDVKVIKNEQISGSLVEKIDFETERFSVKDNESAYKIYTAALGDKNVHSGNNSLKFSYNSKKSNESIACLEGFLAKQIGVGISYKLTFYIKTIKDGKVSLAPEFSKTLGNANFEVSVKKGEWTKVEYRFINTQLNFIKLLISSIAKNTKSDFYIDDITLEVANPMILEKSPDETYCESFYNEAANGDFEAKYAKNVFTNLPNTAKIEASDNAASGDNLLKVSSATNCVIKIPVSTATAYTFAFSYRGTNLKARVGIATNDKYIDSSWYFDDSDKPASYFDLVDAPKWKRESVSLVTDISGFVYINIKVTSGTLYLDDIMLFKSDFAYDTNPNDYSLFIPFDYNAINKEMTVINGGFGKQNGYLGTDILFGDTTSSEDGYINDESGFITNDDNTSDEFTPDTNTSFEDINISEAPDTSDKTLVLPAILILFTVGIAMFMLCKRRKYNEN